MVPSWGKKILVALSVTSICLVAVITAVPAAGITADSSLWLTDDLGIDTISVAGPSAAIPYSINGNRPCTKRSILTIPKTIYKSESIQSSCVVNTNYGGVSQSGHLQVPGSDIFGEVRSETGARLSLVPIPNSSTAIYLDKGANTGSYAYFVRDFENQLRSSAIFSGEVTHKLKPGTISLPLTDRSGVRLSIDYDSLSFSSSGQYMVASIPYVGVARINTTTMEVLPFGGAFNYNIGLTPAAQTAITNDGRYALVASATFGIFKLYDLKTCGPVPDRLTGPANCKSRDLWAFMKQKTPGFWGASNIRFVGGDALHLYAADLDSNGTRTIRQQFLYAGTKPQSQLQYLALGDSFASGEGAYNYNSLTDTRLNMCHLSLRSYPYLIASSLGLNQQQSIACSGAVIDDVVSTDTEYTGQVPDDVKQFSRDQTKILTSFLPGYISQVQFAEKHRPEVITISTVGNDIGFSDKITRCISGDTCYSTYEERKEALNEINGQFYRTRDMYTTLKEASGPYTKIYAIGYPQITYPDGSCGLNVHLNHEELVFANQLVDFLNDMIRRAAENAGVVYVDVGRALKGHRLCEAVFSNLAVNGLTAGKDKVDLPGIRGPIGNESYHPNALGHRLLEKSILAGTNSFTLTMPPPDTSIGPVEITDSLGILLVPKQDRSLYKAIPKPFAAERFIKNQVEDILVEKLFAPNSSVELSLRSDPVSLGSRTASATGDLDTSITIPSSVPAGYHTLHAFGVNASGEAIDVYQLVYVAESANDVNGNGIPNSDDPCTVVQASGIDADKDAVDDACDPNIEEPPIAVLPPEPTPPIVGSDPPTGNEAPVGGSNPPSDSLNPQPGTTNPQLSESDKLRPLSESNPWASYNPLARYTLSTVQPVMLAVSAVPPVTIPRQAPEVVVVDTGVLGTESVVAVSVPDRDKPTTQPTYKERDAQKSTTITEIALSGLVLIALTALVIYRVSRQKSLL